MSLMCRHLITDSWAKKKESGKLSFGASFIAINRITKAQHLLPEGLSRPESH